MSIKNILSNLLIEQDENLVTITPEQYLENLEDVGGIADRVAKLKPYKGKGIVINGNLDLRNFKNVGPLTGIVRIMGRLIINNTNISNLNGITVDGYIDDYGSSMWRTKKQLELNKKLAELDQKRKEDEWNIGNGDDDSIRTSALFDILKLNGEVGMTGDGEGNVEVSEDKYFLYPQGRGIYGYGKQYEWLGGDAGFEGNLYDVYTEDEAYTASKSAVSDMIEDMGYGAFSSWVWDNSIDKDKWIRWLDEFYTDVYYDDPEGNNVPLTLSTTQQAQVDKLNKSIEDLEAKLATNTLSKDSEYIVLKKIEGFENIIEDIEGDPQGDYDEEYIQSMVDQKVDEYEYNIDTFIKEYGFDKDFIMDFVDIDKVTEEVVDADGYGYILNSHDGEADYIRVGNEDYYIVRVS
jgi:hypothetical protein